jgi:hypothetical protein
VFAQLDLPILLPQTTKLVTVATTVAMNAALPGRPVCYVASAVAAMGMHH